MQVIDSYKQTSTQTYEDLRDWLPLSVSFVLLVHIGFFVSNTISGESENAITRLVAMALIFPFAFCKMLDGNHSTKQLLQNSLLIVLIAAGPTFLATGLLEEIRGTDPDVLVVIQRQFEFLGTLAILLVVSASIRIALATCLAFVTVSFLAYNTLYVLDLTVLVKATATITSAYIWILFALFVFVRIQTDKKRSKVESLALVGASIAHELRTPLQSIRLLAKTMSDASSPVSIDIQEASCEIVDEADSALTLIDMLLMNASSGSVNKNAAVEFRVVDAIRQGIDRYPYSSPRDSKIIEFTPNSTDSTIFGSRLLLVHVVFNLLKNALEHVAIAPNPSVKVTLFRRGSWAILEVEDNAGNIEGAYSDRIFDQFFTNSQSFGTGIGLTFCRETVERHFNGTMRCEFETGEFTRFVVEIPLYGTKR